RAAGLGRRRRLLRRLSGRQGLAPGSDRVAALGVSMRHRVGLLVLLLAVPMASRGEAPLRRDGQHDFDFEIGTWKTHLRRLKSPPSGSKDGVEYDGTSVVRGVAGGKANLVELVADGPAGHFEGISLRLYNPESRQWSLNFANIRSGTLSTPT